MRIRQKYLSAEVVASKPRSGEVWDLMGLIFFLPGLRIEKASFQSSLCPALPHPCHRLRLHQCRIRPLHTNSPTLRVPVLSAHRLSKS